MDTIARIRREHFVHGRSIKEIVRALHVSRNTVRKVLRSGKTAFAYEREVQPLPKLGQWRVDLDELLAANGPVQLQSMLDRCSVRNEARASILAGRVRVVGVAK